MGLFLLPKMPENEIPIVGTKEEQDLFTEVYRHYTMAKQDLETRMRDWDKKDVLFRSHLDESSWPYQSLVFDPRVFTTIYEKTARTLANKPRGRMIPREGGDVLKAKINNEILSFEWDDNERVDNSPMLAKWALMDQNARKYGASFGIADWHWEQQVTGKGKEAKRKIVFDGPNFRPLNNRDCLPNPSYSTVKNWFQERGYPTLQELQNVNNSTRSKAIYKNLDLLKQQMRTESKKGGDTRAANYTNKNLALKGLTDFLGQDEVYKTVEVITEYRNDRWITFSPKHGIILRDIPNPYDHSQIPVVLLKYYPIDEDLYGLSEIEPVEKLQKAINAVVCQYLDAINMSLYTPLKVNQLGGAVQMHTLEFGPAKKWLMNNPATDVIAHDQNVSGVQEFTSTYRFLVGALQEALGETSAAASNLVPGEGNKTATEIKDTSMSRSARDNFNQIFLGEALKKQMLFWFEMNKQFMFSNPAEKYKIIRVVGKDAIKYFQNAGLDGNELSDETTQMMTDPSMEGVNVGPADLESPRYPIQTKEGTVSKMSLDETGEGADLYVEPDDICGVYDYIPDVGSMSSAANQEEIAAKGKAIELLITNPTTQQILLQEGKTIKASELITDYLEDIGFKNADQYFENAQGGMNGLNQPGGAGLVPGQQGMVNGAVGGIPGMVPPPAGGQAQPIVS